VVFFFFFPCQVGGGVKGTLVGWGRFLGREGRFGGWVGGGFMSLGGGGVVIFIPTKFFFFLQFFFFSPLGPLGIESSSSP